MKKTLIFVCILFFGFQVNAYAGDEIQFLARITITERGYAETTEIFPVSPTLSKMRQLKIGKIGEEISLPDNIKDVVDLSVYILQTDLQDPCVRVGNRLVCW